MSLYSCAQCGRHWRSGFFGGRQCPACPRVAVNPLPRILGWAFVLLLLYSVLIGGARAGLGGVPAVKEASVGAAFQYADFYSIAPQDATATRRAARAASSAE